MSTKEYKVLITTSGIGSRLKDVTRVLNKALVRIGDKPAISRIIESYPKDVPFVITLGYLAAQVKEFLLMAYPDRTFEFAYVDKYEGEGASLGYSMLQAKDYLDCPFIFHCCDTIVTEEIPTPDSNWMAGYMVDKEDTDLPLHQYRTHKIVDGKVVRLNEKGEDDFESIHIGLIGVQDYELFWKTLSDQYEDDPLNTGHSDVHVVDAMIKDGVEFALASFSEWLDTGNPDSLERTQQYFKETYVVLEKIEESIYFFDTFVIKFFSDKEKLQHRVARAAILKGVVPEIEAAGKFFYRYTHVSGDLFASVANNKNIVDFLTWTQKNVWKEANEVSKEEFKKVCHAFYYKKTKERLRKLFESGVVTDSTDRINGVEVPKIYDILENVDFDWLSNSEQTLFHGDLILDNILKTTDGWCLIDWRQDFGGLLESGDLYYDLGKLNHNMTVNHDIVDQNRFVVDDTGHNVECSIEIQEHLVEAQEAMFEFLEKAGYDVLKVKTLSAIIWLNMAPLHNYPFNFNKFLYYYGKLALWQTLQQNK